MAQAEAVATAAKVADSGGSDASTSPPASGSGESPPAAQEAIRCFDRNTAIVAESAIARAYAELAVEESKLAALRAELALVRAENAAEDAEREVRNLDRDVKSQFRKALKDAAAEVADGGASAAGSAGQHAHQGLGGEEAEISLENYTLEQVQTALKQVFPLEIV